MIYILTIGYVSLAFDSMKGLDTVIRTIGKGLRVERDYEENKLSWKVVTDERKIECNIETDSKLTLVKGKACAYQPERVVVTPEVVRDDLFGERSSPRQIAGSKCLPAFRNKAIRQ